MIGTEYAASYRDGKNKELEMCLCEFLITVNDGETFDFETTSTVHP